MRVSEQFVCHSLIHRAAVCLLAILLLTSCAATDGEGHVTSAPLPPGGSTSQSGIDSPSQSAITPENTGDISGRDVSAYPLDFEPCDVWVGPDETVYVEPCNDGSPIAMIRNGSTTYIPVPDVLAGAVAPDGTLYVTHDGGLLTIRDGKIVDTIPVSTQNYGVAVAPDGVVYVTDLGEPKVSVIEGGMVARTVPLHGSAMSLAADIAVATDGTVYIAAGEGSGKGTTVSMLVDGDFAGSFSLSVENPSDIASASDGTVYISSYDSKTISVIRDRELNTTIELDGSPNKLAAGPGGILYAVGFDKVWLIKDNKVVDGAPWLGPIPFDVGVGGDGTVYSLDRSSKMVQELK